VNSLPATSSIQGRSTFTIANGEAKALGMLPANGTAIDGVVGFGRNIPLSSLVGVALHEITHAFGRLAGTGMDIFRYNAPGNHVFGGSVPQPASYFSINGGSTKIADFGQSSDPGDFLNSGVQGPNDPFNEFYSSSTIQNLTTADLRIMDVLGFQRNLSFQGSAVGEDDGSAISSVMAMPQSDGGTFLSAVMPLPGSDGGGSQANMTPGADQAALMASHMASTFPQPSGQTTSPDPSQGQSSQPFLAKPMA